MAREAIVPAAMTLLERAMLGLRPFLLLLLLLLPLPLLLPPPPPLPLVPAGFASGARTSPTGAATSFASGARASPAVPAGRSVVVTGVWPRRSSLR
ncbi:MAG: hypothetical protein WAK71_29350, partial [Streptosporangiaceae bacterium]